MAGLGAARTLRAAGIATVIFEKSRGLGGRVATRYVGDYTFDHGATVISPRGSELERVILEELPTVELVDVTAPIYLANDDRVTAVDPEGGKIKRYAYAKGNSTLGRLLGEGIESRLEMRVEEISKSGPHYLIDGESFSHVILNPPIPQSEVLLASLGDKRSFPGAQYRQCLSVMFGVASEIDRPYHAILDPNQSQPLTWLSLEHVKCPGGFRAPEGHAAVVVQMSARYSRYSFERSDEDILRETWVDVKRVLELGNVGYEVGSVMRWRYSHSSNTVGFETANPQGAKVLVVGDGLSGARTHQAYETGVRAARQILEEI
jgi:renalase